jgi:hypothetical protein
MRKIFLLMARIRTLLSTSHFFEQLFPHIYRCIDRKKKQMHWTVIICHLTKKVRCNLILNIHNMNSLHYHGLVLSLEKPFQVFPCIHRNIWLLVDSVTFINIKERIKKHNPKIWTNNRACSLELSAAYFQPASSIFLSQQISQRYF